MGSSLDDVMQPGDWIIHDGPAVDGSPEPQFEESDPIYGGIWGRRKLAMSSCANSAYLFVSCTSTHLVVWDPIYRKSYILQRENYPNWVRATEAMVNTTWQRAIQDSKLSIKDFEVLYKAAMNPNKIHELIDLPFKR